MEIWIILRFSIAAAIIALVCWSLASAVRDSWQVARRMHSIPCSHCRYFTNDYRLNNTEKLFEMVRNLLV